MIWADTVGGHIYGIPWLLDTGHLFYRKDILDANGLKPATTWQELHDQGVMLAEEVSQDGALRGLLPVGPAADLQLHGVFLEQRRRFPRSQDGRAWCFNSPQNVEALEMMISLDQG